MKNENSLFYNIEIKKLKFNVLFSAIVILLSLQLEAKPLINSHLRTWNEQLVVSHLHLGADIVEIDISDLANPELHKIMVKLPKFPKQFLALHLKGFNETSIPQIESFLEKYENLWKQFWFFSGDANIDLHVKSKYTLGYITRSTKHDVISCLTFGFEDDAKFLSHCISKDIWVRPSMMANAIQKNRMKLLIQKIRNYEKINPVPPALIALDQIDNKNLYCELVSEFSSLVDGIVTEDFEEILPLLNGHQSCS